MKHPKEFTKDHINITEATVADPVALDPVMEPTANELQNQFRRAGIGNPPRMRGLYDEPGADPPITRPSDTDPPISAEQLAVRMTHGGIHRAIDDAGFLRTDDAYTYDVIDPSTGEVYSTGDASADYTVVGALTTTEPAAGTTDGSIPPKPFQKLLQKVLSTLRQ